MNGQIVRGAVAASEDLKSWVIMATPTQCFLGKPGAGGRGGDGFLLRPAYLYLESVQVDPRQGLSIMRFVVPIGGFVGALEIAVSPTFVIKLSTLEDADRAALAELVAKAELMRTHLRGQATGIIPASAMPMGRPR